MAIQRDLSLIIGKEFIQHLFIRNKATKTLRDVVDATDVIYTVRAGYTEGPVIINKSLANGVTVGIKKGELYITLTEVDTAQLHASEVYHASCDIIQHGNRRTVLYGKLQAIAVA